MVEIKPNPALPPVPLVFLLKESLLLILLIYFVMVGGTYNGMVLYTFQRMNAVLLGLAGLGWLGWRFIARKGGGSNWLDWPLLAWLGVVALTSSTSSNPRLSWEAFGLDLAVVLLFSLLVDLLRSGWNEDIWLRVVLISAGVVVLFGLIQFGLWYASWWQIGGWRDPIPPATLRISSTLGHPNILAAYLNLILPVCLAGMVLARSRFVKILAGGQALMILGLLFGTSSRGGWVGSAAALGVFVLLLGIDQRQKVRESWDWLRRRKIVLVGLVLAGLVGAALAGALLYRQMQHPSHPGLSNPADARNYIWAVAIGMARQFPVLGEGPFTFGTEFIRTYSYPPGMLLAHSHNYLLNSLAEMGVVGMIVVLIVGVFVGVAVIKRWQAGKPGERTQLAGVIAALAGLAVHSQLDTPETVLVINIILAVYLAILVAPLAPVSLLGWPLPGWVLSGFRAAEWLVLIGLLVFSLQGSGALDGAVNAAVAQDWTQAAHLADTAAQQDPGMAHYWFQSGVAHAQLAFGGEATTSLDGSELIRPLKDSQELALAIQTIQTGLAMDGSNSINWANLGIWQWSAGDRANGLASLRKAAGLAPGSALILRLQGWMEEASGQPERARAAYRQMVALSPETAQSRFLQATVLRREFAAGSTVTSGGWTLLAAGDFNGAEAAFRAQSGLNNASAFRGLGMALMAQNRDSEAEKALRTADFIEPGQAGTLQALAGLYAQMGRRTDAMVLGEQVKALESQPPSAGPEMQGDTDVAFYIYHREALPVILVGLKP